MLEIRQLTTRYEDRTILKDINLDFAPHEVSVIVGPSGAGKSTLLRSLNALVLPESGQLRLGDLFIDYQTSLKAEDLQTLRRRMTMVFQNFNLFSHLTVLENVMEGPVHVLQAPASQVAEEAKQLLSRLGLADKVDQYPSQLSGGQQQRVAIARAIIMQPDFLLLDEPTSALDPELEVEIAHVLSELAQDQLAMILVTHNLALARLVADRILFMEEGAIYFDGSADQFFMAEDPRIQRYLESMQLSKLALDTERMN